MSKKSEYIVCDVPKGEGINNGDVFKVDGKCMNHFGDLVECKKGNETLFLARVK